MARIYIQDEDRHIEGAEAISSFLEPFGIWYEHWGVEGRIGPDANDAEILAAYAPEIERLKSRGGFVTADLINVKPETPGLQGMLDRFNREHTHSDDEVRFIVQGRGIFQIHGKAGTPEAQVFAIQVEAGDLINVPAGTRHWFDLCADRQIRAIRLFIDTTGWTPEYLEDGVHARYQPLCFGPEFVPLGAAAVPQLQL